MTIPQSTSHHASFWNRLRLDPDFALKTCVTIWFFIYLLGQQFFAVYIAFRWGMPLFTGNYDSINDSNGINGYIPGDTSGNGMLYIHVIGAAIMAFSGMLQFVPSLRTRFPGLHRINGRLFLTLGILGALTGLYLTWLRGSRLSDIGSLGVTVNGILIPVFIYYAWRFAITKKIALHRRFTVHAFLLVNGVWTFRLYLMGWFIATQGGLGNSRNIDGPADMVISFSSYLLPMCFAELYFWAERQQNVRKKWLAFSILCIGGLLTLFGIICATLLMWMPRIGIALGA